MPALRGRSWWWSRGDSFTRQPVLIVAQNALELGFDYHASNVGRGPLRAGGAADHVYHRLPELPAGGPEFLAVTLRELLLARKPAPGLRVLNAQAGFENSIVPEMMDIPWLVTGGTMNVHITPFPK
jgi:hypothetical protein